MKIIFSKNLKMIINFRIQKLQVQPNNSNSNQFFSIQFILQICILPATLAFLTKDTILQMLTLFQHQLHCTNLNHNNSKIIFMSIIQEKIRLGKHSKKNSKKSDIVTIRSGTYLPYLNSDIKFSDICSKTFYLPTPRK